MLLGAVVLVIAVIALNQPKGRVSGDTNTRTVVRTISSTPTKAPTSTGKTAPPTRSSATSATSSTSRSSSPPAGSAKSVPLVVLNDTTTSQLASQAAQRFENGGWTVTRFGNLPGSITDILSTCAYYDPTVSGAQAAAEALQRQYPTIQRVKEKFSDLPAGPVVVVLTSDYVSG